MHKNKDFQGINFADIKKFQTVEGRYRNKITGKALSFLKGTLTMSPHDRLTAEEALLHPYFEDQRLKDEELADFNQANDPKVFSHVNFNKNNHTQRLDSTKATDGGGKEERRNSNSKNTQVKIRIKTIVENPQQENKRKSGVQSMQGGKVSPIGFSDEAVGMNSTKKGPKTYYNIYEKNNQFEDAKYYKQNQWRVFFH